LLTQWRPLLEKYTSMIESVAGARDKPTGLVRLFVHTSIANYVLAPVLPLFLAEYPDISVEVCTDPLKSDILAEHFDAGIRAQSRIGAGMTMIRISDDRKFGIVGSPAYFADHPPPRTLDDLSEHNCIRFRNVDGDIEPWRLGKAGKTELKIRGNLVVAEIA